ncbi:MAG: hypothetical protein N2651_06095 [Fimbriimonadales bacterium]|nr:hypothetical protein [Fimbriimonadales bacterium]
MQSLFAWTLGWLLTLGGWTQIVEFPEGYYAYYEIAERVSVAGQQVDCSPDVRQHMALLRLKPRTWEQARTVLESTLPIRFQQLDENRWRMERDPVVAATDQRLRKLLAQRMEQQIQETQARVQRALAGKFTGPPYPSQPSSEQRVEVYYNFNAVDKPYTEWLALQFHYVPVQRWRRYWDAWNTLNEQLRVLMQERPLPPATYPRKLQEENWLYYANQVPLSNFGMPDEIMRWARQAARWEPRLWARVFFEHAYYPPDRERRAKLAVYYARDVLRTYLEIELVNHVLAQVAPEIPLLEVMEQGTWTSLRTVRLDSDLKRYWLRQSPPPRAAGTEAVPMLIRVSWHNRSRRDALKIQCEFQAEGQAYIPAISVTVYAPTSQTDQESLYRKVGPSHLEQYRQRLERHRTFGAQMSATVPKPVSSPAHWYFLEWMRVWATAHDQEVAAELVYRSSLLPDFSDLGEFQRALSETHYPRWFVDKVGGVWTVWYPAGFIDRLPRPALPAMRELLRSEMDYDACLRFYQSLSMPEAAWFSYNDETVDMIPQWLGVRLEGAQVHMSRREFSQIWFLMHLLTHLPEAERASLIAAARGSDRRAVSLRCVPPESRVAFTRSLRAWFSMADDDVHIFDASHRLLWHDDTSILERIEIHYFSDSWWVRWREGAERTRDLFATEYPRLARDW